MPIVSRCGRDRTVEVHSVPALHHLGTARPEAEHEAAPRQRLHRHRGHCQHRRRARADLGDARRERDALRLGREVGERGQRIKPHASGGRPCSAPSRSASTTKAASSGDVTTAPIATRIRARYLRSLRSWNCATRTDPRLRRRWRRGDRRPGVGARQRHQLAGAVQQRVLRCGVARRGVRGRPRVAICGTQSPSGDRRVGDDGDDRQNSNPAGVWLGDRRSGRAVLVVADPFAVRRGGRADPMDADGTGVQWDQRGHRRDAREGVQDPPPAARRAPSEHAGDARRHQAGGGRPDEFVVAEVGTTMDATNLDNDLRNPAHGLVRDRVGPRVRVHPGTGKRRAEPPHDLACDDQPRWHPHVTGVGALWVDGSFWFETGERTRKGRNLARDPRCTLASRPRLRPRHRRRSAQGHGPGRRSRRWPPAGPPADGRLVSTRAGSPSPRSSALLRPDRRHGSCTASTAHTGPRSPPSSLAERRAGVLAGVWRTGCARDGWDGRRRAHRAPFSHRFGDEAAPFPRRETL